MNNNYNCGFQMSVFGKVAPSKAKSSEVGSGEMAINGSKNSFSSVGDVDVDYQGSSAIQKQQRVKRRLDSGSEEVDGNSKKNYVHGRKVASAFSSNTYSSTNANSSLNNKRKANFSSSIKGQVLPITRGVELMDKEQLQNVLMNLINEYPHIQASVHSNLEAINFPINKYLSILKLKYNEIIQNIPYSRNNYYDDNTATLNDYAFVRMKPYILEFLNCLADYILDNIPPRVENLHDSLKFLDCCTEMVLTLPRFDLASNNYYYDKCLEQLSYLWCNVIELLALDLVLLVNDEHLLVEYLEKLTQYNERSQGILHRPLQLFKTLDLNFSQSTNNLNNMFNSTQNNFDASFSSSQGNGNDTNSRNAIVYE